MAFVSMISSRRSLHFTVFMLFAVFALFSCSDSVSVKQAGIYEEYTEKIAGAAGYDELKKVNNELNSELMALLRENSEELVEEVKSRPSADDVKTLNDAEKAYVSAYISKIAPLIMQKQDSVYDACLDAVTKAASATELTSQKNKANAALDKIARDNSWELKMMAANGGFSKEMAALNSQKRHLDTVYVKVAAPFLIGEINSYTDKVMSADGYEELKELKLQLGRRMASYCTEKDTLLNNLVTGRECDREIRGIISSKLHFDSVYMNKFMPYYLEKEAMMYDGVTELLMNMDNPELLNELQKYFPRVQNYFFSVNMEEKKWLERAQKSNPDIFGKQVQSRNEAIMRMNELYNEKMNAYNN